LKDIRSISILHDKVKMGPSGLDAAAVGNGQTAYSFDGGDYVAIHTPALAAAFDGAAGWAVVAVSIPNPAVWADATVRTFLRLGTVGGTADQIQIRKTAVANQVEALYRTGGVSHAVQDISLAASPYWFLLGITWDTADDEVKVYLNGVQIGATLGGLAAWVGTLDSTVTFLGVTNATPGAPHIGLLSHAAIGAGAVLTPVEMAEIYAARFGDLRGVINSMNPIAYWRLGEASGTVAASDTGAAFNGALGAGAAAPTVGQPGIVAAVITEVGGKRIHTYSTDGTFTVVNRGTFEYLVVAGGGGGGNGDGGGGGAGGLVAGTQVLEPGTYQIRRGLGRPGGPAGGAGAYAAGTPGEDSGAFATLNPEQLATMEANRLDFNDTQSTGASTIAASAASALRGSFGAIVTPGAAGTTSYGRLLSPNNELLISAGMRFDPNTLTMANLDELVLLFLEMDVAVAGAVAVAQVNLVRAGANYELKPRYVDDAATFAGPGTFVITDGPHTILLTVKAASAPGANDGEVKFYIDDALMASITGIDNDQRLTDIVSYGNRNVLVNTGIVGGFYVDDCWWRDSIETEFPDFGVEAFGGGGGGSAAASLATTGGSGGGAGVGDGLPPRTGANGIAGQGNKGGDATFGAPNLPGGGGGGAGAVGQNAVSTAVAGAGGAGVASSISGAAVTYAGGGGGGTYNGGTAGAGGAGGGGAGSNSSAAAGTAGTDGRGGGGGGGAENAAGTVLSAGGEGGDGIVIISYTTPAQIDQRQAGFLLNLVHRDTSPGFSDATFLNFTPEERAEGGLHSVRFEMYGRLTTLKEMFERALGRWVEVWGYGLELEFEGIITEAIFNLPPDRFTNTLEPVANKGVMRADLNADGVVDRSTTIQNAASQEQYPISDLVLGGGQVEGLVVADQTIRQYINLRALPRPSLQLGGASGEVHLELFARGFIWTLARQVYNQTALTGAQSMSAEVRDILSSGKAEYVARQVREANTTSVTREHDADRRPMDIIVDMTRLGDANNNRWLAAMRGRSCVSAVGRVFLLKQAAPPIKPPTI
jgi:hypothetical protein